ncbi:MAG: porphobilinogen synthase [Crenarchaeota archaeon]|nr:porphobilinogen synthase [Thermoproteota archaeon]
MRRLRKTSAMRELLKEITVRPTDLICPIFVDETAKKPIPIDSMPGYYRLPTEKVVDEAQKVLSQDVKAIILFGIPAVKDEVGSSAFANDGVIQNAIKKLKSQFGEELIVIADLCMCEYTSHGHCGILKNGFVENDQTLSFLQKIAVSYAQAGIDIVAPSAMMDGQVKAIRTALDDSNFSDVPIMAYSAKFASGFYGPFRDAASSTPQFGDRKSYQINHCNFKEAIREIELDINEGADIIMVKPAMTYLDVIYAAKNRFNVPIAAYNVSGEYSMIKAAAQNGWIDEKIVALELLNSIKRAGSDIIITYFAKEVKTWLT